MDYAYTLQGWLKGVNSVAINPAFDMGADGADAAGITSRDVFGFSLNYFMGNYKPIDATALPFSEAGAYIGTGYKPLYNGNISHIAIGVKGLKTSLYNYGYDQLNRLVSMDAYHGFDSLTNQWSALTLAGKYGEQITYDANGNILTYNRDGNKSGTSLAMDRLTYSYIPGTNQLDHVQDNVTDAEYAEDIDGQASGRYVYDAIGNLIKDSLDQIEWTVYGKISQITKTNGMEIAYTYDASGNRISKTLSGTGVVGGPVTTWYARDAQGNTLTTYELKGGNITANEQYLYGSSRIGVINRNLALTGSLTIPGSTIPGIGEVYATEMLRGTKQYELVDHRQNVYALISDRKKPVFSGSTVDYYEAEVVSAQDYYPGGMEMPGRSVNSLDYRYSINGQEKTPEVGANTTTAKFWQYDARIGRRWNLDPIYNTDISRYAVNGNNPNYFKDPLGNFKTKFGAQLYSVFHGGKVSRDKTQGKSRSKEWFVGRQTENKDGEIVYTRRFSARSYKDNKVGSGGLYNPVPDPIDAIDALASKVEDFKNISAKNLSDLWYSPLARAIIPDYYTISGSFQTSSGIYANEEVSLTLMLRGRDPGLYFNSVTGFGAVSSAGADVGCSIGKGYYNGDARNLSSSVLGGWQGSISFGLGGKIGGGGSINGGIDAGYNDQNKLTTTTSKIGISLGVGVSAPGFQGNAGAGFATPAIPIFKF